MPKILLVGSIAFDIVFHISQDFQKSIPLQNGKIEKFNASYVANEKQEYPGGSSGNIAYWLGKQNISASIFAPVGEDFRTKGYRKKLEEFESEIRGLEKGYTANAYMISDPLHQQLIIWQPNIYAKNEESSLFEYYTDEELRNFDFACFSPGTPASIAKHMNEFRQKNKNAMIIFDPGQITPLFDKNIFQKCQKYSEILIGNDTEFQHFKTLEIQNNILKIETLGKKGVRTELEKKEKIFKTTPNEEAVNVTGAGDAFRAGFLASLSLGEDFERAIQNGMKWGAECVKYPSGQGN